MTMSNKTMPQLLGDLLDQTMTRGVCSGYVTAEAFSSQAMAIELRTFSPNPSDRPMATWPIALLQRYLAPVGRFHICAAHSR